LNDHSFTSAPQLKRDPLGGTPVTHLVMKSRLTCSTDWAY